MPTSAKVGIAGFFNNNKARLQKCNRAFFVSKTAGLMPADRYPAEPASVLPPAAISESRSFGWAANCRESRRIESHFFASSDPLVPRS